MVILNGTTNNWGLESGNETMVVADGSGIKEGFYTEEDSFQTGQQIKYYPVAIKNSTQTLTSVAMKVNVIGIIDGSDEDNSRYSDYLWTWDVEAEDGGTVPVLTGSNNERTATFERIGLYEVRVTVRKEGQTYTVAEVRFGLDVISQRRNDTFNISVVETPGSYSWFLSGKNPVKSYYTNDHSSD